MISVCIFFSASICLWSYHLLGRGTLCTKGSQSKTTVFLQKVGIRSSPVAPTNWFASYWMRILRLCGISYQYRVSRYPTMYVRYFCQLMGHGMTMCLAIPESSATSTRLFSCSGNVVCQCNAVMPIRTSLEAESCRGVPAQKRGIKCKIRIEYRNMWSRHIEYCDLD